MAPVTRTQNTTRIIQGFANDHEAHLGGRALRVALTVMAVVELAYACLGQVFASHAVFAVQREIFDVRQNRTPYGKREPKLWVPIYWLLPTRQRPTWLA